MEDKKKERDRKPISARKLEANRRNSTSSTGPKTLGGKSKSRLNALKHGLLAEAMLIDMGDAHEDPREWRALLKGLRQYYEPAGMTEDLLVERIGMYFWRHRRAIRCENGEIRRRSSAVFDEIVFDRRWNYALEQTYRGSFPNWELTCTPPNLRLAIEALRRAKEELIETGYIQEKVCDALKALGHWEIADFCASAKRPPAPDPANDLSKPGDPDDDRPGKGDGCLRSEEKAKLLHLIEGELTRLDNIRSVKEKNERLGEVARNYAASLPFEEAAQRINRYEMTIDRMLYRTIAKLESMQASRRGGSR